MKSFACIVSLLSLCSSPLCARPIDGETAEKAFRDFEQLCRADNGALWGRSLCGRMMIVDPETREAWFNAEPPTEHRQVSDRLFAGRYDNANVANTSVDWDGERWIQLVEVPEETEERRALLLHEAFHAIQPELGYATGEQLNDHLEEEQARLWLRLEAEALKAALSAEGAEWTDRLRDALRFNRQRAILYPQSRFKESTLVNHEGLAEYTGIALSGGDAAKMAIERLDSVTARPSLVRSIGYVLGPAYALLLDRGRADWKGAALAGAPLPLLLEAALDGGAEPGVAARAYDMERIAREEAARGEERAAELADLRRRFVEGPVLILPFRRMNITFNPNRVVGLDNLGTIRSGAEVTDLWGRLVAKGDVLLAGNWSSARVPLAAPPSGQVVEGDDWVLTLSDGWKAVPGEREGDWILRPIE